MDDAGQAGADRRRRAAAVPRALRSAPGGLGARAHGARRRGRRRHRSGVAGGREPRRGPHPAPLRQCRAGGGPHQFLPDRRQGAAEAPHRHQVRKPHARCLAAAASALRNLRVFAADRGRASALRQDRARRHPLVRPAAGLPHRNSRPCQGAAGQERGHRSGRRQGRLRAEAVAQGRPARCSAGGRHGRLRAVHFHLARHHRQPRRQGHPCARQRRAPRRRRSLSRGRRRQGHRDLLRHRQWHRPAARVLARRRLRLRRLGRLRPQEDGHHRPRRLGIGQAPLPRARRRHRQDAVHRRRHRRHVGRRVRQRHAAGRHDQAGRRFRPPRHLHRPRSRSGKELARAPAPVRAAAFELAGLRQGAHFPGRRRVPARAQGNRAVGGGARGARLRRRPRRRRRR